MEWYEHLARGWVTPQPLIVWFDPQHVDPEDVHRVLVALENGEPVAMPYSPDVWGLVTPV